jgi:hypothetical protein
MTPIQILEMLDEDGEPITDDLILIEEGVWKNNYKDFDLKQDIYRWRPTDQFFNVCSSRSGSYYSDYEYDDPTCGEVVQKVITKTIYVAKK